MFNPGFSLSSAGSYPGGSERNLSGQIDWRRAAFFADGHGRFPVMTWLPNVREVNIEIVQAAGNLLDLFFVECEWMHGMSLVMVLMNYAE